MSEKSKPTNFLQKPISRRKLLKLAGAGAVITGGLGGEMFLRGKYYIEVERVNIPLEGITEPFKVALISDLHYTGSHAPCLSLAKKIRSLKPDIVTITGDVISDMNGVDQLLTLINNIGLPTFVVPGNWEIYLQWSAGSQYKFYKAAGVEFLFNKNTYLDFGGGINLVGVSDPFSGEDDLQAAKKGITAARPKILLAHAPIIADQAVLNKMDLTLCGHTHGGQIRLPYLKSPFLPPGSAGFDIGLYDMGTMKLYVNRGIGTSIVPVRFLCPPEITLFTITGA